MKEKKITYTITGDIDDVFSRITAAIQLSLNENSETLNTSYAQPVGTKFQYREKSFGQDVAYTAQITKFEKPQQMEFELTDDKTKTVINVNFCMLQIGETEVTYTISLKDANWFQRFFKRHHIDTWMKRFDDQVSLTRKILGH